MTSYNFRFLSLALIASFALSACVNRDPHITKNGATFFVDSVKSDITPNKLNASDDVNQKFVNVSACLKDNAQMAVIMNIAFTIKAGDVKFTKVTDDQGCLIWQELYEYDPKDYEKQISITRTISANQGHAGSVDMQLVYNPWKDTSLTFLRTGLRAQGAENVATIYSKGEKITNKDFVNGSEVSSQVDLKVKFASSTRKALDVSSLTMKFISRDFDNYSITPAMDLTIAHLYRLRFNSFVVRHTLDHGMVLEALSAGRFRFYFILLREGYSKNVPADQMYQYVVSSTTFDADGSLGRFVTDVSMKFDNIGALASRMTGIITMEPIDQPDAYLTSSFEGVISPIGGSAGQNLDLLPSNLSAKKLAQDYNTFHTKNKKRFGLDLLTSQFSPMQTLVYFSDNKQLDLTPVLVQKRNRTPAAPGVANINPKFICSAYLGNLPEPSFTSILAGCNENSFNESVREFVSNIDSAPVPVGGPQVETLAIASQISFSDDSTKSSGASLKYNSSIYGSLGAAFSLTKLLNAATALFGLNLTAEAGYKITASNDYYGMTAVDKKSDIGTSVAEVRAETITSEAFKFRINMRTKSCLLITATPEFRASFRGLNIPEGRYYCDDKTESKVHEELFYFVNQSSGSASSPLSDNMSGVDNPWRMFIRGEDNYRLFAQLFSNKNTKITFGKMPDQEMLKTLNHYVSQELPGMITPQKIAK
jgi:hypothetical protein